MEDNVKELKDEKKKMKKEEKLQKKEAKKQAKIEKKKNKQPFDKMYLAKLVTAVVVILLMVLPSCGTILFYLLDK